jgi:hypothetical protein
MADNNNNVSKEEPVAGTSTDTTANSAAENNVILYDFPPVPHSQLPVSYQPFVHLGTGYRSLNKFDTKSVKFTVMKNDKVWVAPKTRKRKRSPSPRSDNRADIIVSGDNVAGANLPAQVAPVVQMPDVPGSAAGQVEVGPVAQAPVEVAPLQVAPQVVPAPVQIVPVPLPLPIPPVPMPVNYYFLF